MNKNLKKTLYESIMNTVSKEIKKQLNEDLLNKNKFIDFTYTLWKHNISKKVYVEIKSPEAYEFLLRNNPEFNVKFDSYWKEYIKNDLQLGRVLITPYRRHNKNLLFRTVVKDYKLDSHFLEIGEISREDFTISYWEDNNWPLHESRKQLIKNKLNESGPLEDDNILDQFIMNGDYGPFVQNSIESLIKLVRSQAMKIIGVQSEYDKDMLDYANSDFNEAANDEELCKALGQTIFTILEENSKV